MKNSKKIDNKYNEEVLVVKTDILNQIGYFQGFQSAYEPYKREIYKEGNAFFTKRGPAETDPGLKQIIPYCIMIQGEGDILFYRRGKSSGENRLRELWSCGIGGHINPIDIESKLNITFDETSLRKSLLREIKEELIIPEGDITFKTIGFINDDSDDVGKVHIGIVEIAFIPNGKVKANEDAIEEINFMNYKEINADQNILNLEKWSRLVIKNLTNHLSI